MCICKLAQHGFRFQKLALLNFAHLNTSSEQSHHSTLISADGLKQALVLKKQTTPCKMVNQQNVQMLIVIISSKNMHLLFTIGI